MSSAEVIPAEAAIVEPRALAAVPPSGEQIPAASFEGPLAIVAAAVQRGMSAEELRPLVELANDMRQEQARIALDEALSEFQAMRKPIPRNKTARVERNGQTLYTYDYADLAQIAKSIRPGLKRAGLSVTYDAKFEGGAVIATATVRKAGASVSATFQAMINTQVNLNQAQLTGGALTYAKRQALMLVLGLDCGDDDDDAARSGGAPGRRADCITESQAADLRALVEEVKAVPKLVLQFANAESFEEVRIADFDRIVAMLNKKRARS